MERYHRDWSDFLTLTSDSTPLPLKRPHQGWFPYLGDRYPKLLFKNILLSKPDHVLYLNHLSLFKIPTYTDFKIHCLSNVLLILPSIFTQIIYTRFLIMSLPFYYMNFQILRNATYQFNRSNESLAHELHIWFINWNTFTLYHHTRDFHS